MPTYEFFCNDCQRVFNERRTFAKADDPATCPRCQQGSTRRLLSTGIPTQVKLSLREVGEAEYSKASRHVKQLLHGVNCSCCPRESAHDEAAHEHTHEPHDHDHAHTHGSDSALLPTSD